MKKTILSFLLYWLLLPLTFGAMRPQPAPTVTVDENGFASLSWFALSGRTYFVQYSYDLENWRYTDEIIRRRFSRVVMVFDPRGETFYLRLRYTDIAAYDVESANFDQAGGTNREELDAGTDPLEAEAGEVRVVIPGSGNPAPPPEVEGIVYDEEGVPVYLLKLVETGGLADKTRFYFLNSRYELLPGLQHPDLGTGETTFPADIARSPAGVETEVTFELVVLKDKQSLRTTSSRSISFSSRRITLP